MHLLALRSSSRLSPRSASSSPGTHCYSRSRKAVPLHLTYYCTTITQHGYHHPLQHRSHLHPLGWQEGSQARLGTFTLQAASEELKLTPYLLQGNGTGDARKTAIESGEPSRCPPPCIIASCTRLTFGLLSYRQDRPCCWYPSRRHCPVSASSALPARLFSSSPPSLTCR